MKSLQGRFVWYELMAADMAAASQFYAAVLGWTTRDEGLAGKPYNVVRAGETAVAGIVELMDDARALRGAARLVGYIGAADVDGAVARLAALGGELRRPAEDIPGIGRFAVVLDPQRARFILFQPFAGSAPEAAAPGTRGTVGWHELHAADGAAAFAFYASLFGWSSADIIDMGPMGPYQMFATGDAPMGGIMNRMNPAAAPEWHYYFNVADIHAAVERAGAAGGHLVNEPHEVPGGSWIAHCTDPQGVSFAVVGPGPGTIG